MTTSQTVCTITDRTFEPGCAVLLNSLIAAGYEGHFVVGLVGDGHRLPNLESMANLSHIQVTFVQLPNKSNVNAHKPSLIEKCFEMGSPDVVFFFDADIVVCRQWRHFLDWVETGIAVCSDVNALWMPPKHPQRSYYRRLLEELDLPAENVTGYANGGFLGLSRENRRVLKVWQQVLDWLDGSEASSWDNWKINAAFGKYDQDALNVALMAVSDEISFVGYEGMSFEKSLGYMVHSIGPHKPWDKGFLRNLLLHGSGLPLATRQFWKHASGPIQMFSTKDLVLARLEMDLTAALSRVIAR